jgi:hypothetical protein
MNDPARVDPYALRQRTHDRRNHWNSNRLVGDRRCPVALRRRLAGFPTGGVTRLNKFSDEAPENAGVTGDVLSAMIIWQDADTHRRYAATDAAVGFEDINVVAGASQFSNARQPSTYDRCQAGHSIDLSSCH